MAQTSAMVIDTGTTAALSSITAATSAERHRRMLRAYYGRKDIDLRSNPTNSTFNTTSYMNHLRGPPSPWRDPPSGRGGGVGVHIHYQGYCPHSPLSHPGNYFGPSRGERPHSEGDAYPFPLPDLTSPYDHDSRYNSSPCGCSQCYWRDFLTTDIEKYNITREQLRETYIWNLRELVRRHRASPKKTREEKDGELEKLYWYYVGRVREIYDNHCRHHRLLFREACLAWETPEKIVLREDDSVGTPPLSRRSNESVRSLASPPSRDPMPFLRGSESRRSMQARVTNKGKEREVIPGPYTDVNTPIRCIDNENNDSESKAKDQTIISPTTIPFAKPELKSRKTPMQQRFRHFWPTKVRRNSSDKAELAQLVRRDSDKHERHEQESVV